MRCSKIQKLLGILSTIYTAQQQVLINNFLLLFIVVELYTAKMSILTCSTDVVLHLRTLLIFRPTLQVVFGRPRAFALNPLIVCDITSIDHALESRFCYRLRW